jgi:hypothetical protein
MREAVVTFRDAGHLYSFDEILNIPFVGGKMRRKLRAHLDIPGDIDIRCKIHCLNMFFVY